MDLRVVRLTDDISVAGDLTREAFDGASDLVDFAGIDCFSATFLGWQRNEHRT